jgi:hypothetical protein
LPARTPSSTRSWPAPARSRPRETAMLGAYQATDEPSNQYTISPDGSDLEGVRLVVETIGAGAALQPARRRRRDPQR